MSKYAVTPSKWLQYGLQYRWLFTVDSVFGEQVKTFMYALIARSPRMLMEAEKHSLFWNYISETARHDFAAINGPELAKQAKLLDGFYVTYCEQD